MHLSPPVATPAALVDLDRLQSNIDAMATRARDAGVRLRPHAKTHKSLEVARLQQDAGAQGLTVATVSEAEVFVAGGFTDLFIAYPLWVDTAKGRRLRALAERAAVTVGIDSVEGARALAAQLGPDRRSVPVLVEVDSGQHRTGVDPARAGTLADQAAHAGLEVAGVFTFPGHSYAPGRQEAVAAQEQQALASARAALADCGIPCPVVSGGSTPTARHLDAGTLTEVRPGVYVFGDAQQLELGTCATEDVAFSVLSTVVSHSGGNVVLDAGSKVLGADRQEWASGYGRLLDHPAARISALSEHHAVVRWGDEAPLPEIGSPVRVVPNHVCNAVNLADTVVVEHHGDLVTTWAVDARGANT